MTLLTPEEYRTVLRQDFYTFLHRAFYELNPQTVFLPNWHIELMAAKLEACRLGHSRRLIINKNGVGKQGISTVAGIKHGNIKLPFFLI